MKNESFCIGLCGQKQVGKDESAAILIPLLSNNMNKKFVRVAFADAVKNTLCMLHYIDEKTKKSKRVTREFIENNKNNDYIPHGWECNIRDALCNIGDRFREINKEAWVDIALLNNNKNKVITDIRYPNEAFKIYNNTKGIVIKIIRPDFEKQKGHRSETSMLEIDRYLPGDYYEGILNDSRLPYNFLLRNDGSIEELKIKIQTKVLPFILDKWKYFN